MAGPWGRQVSSHGGVGPLQGVQIQHPAVVVAVGNGAAAKHNQLVVAHQCRVAAARGGLGFRLAGYLTGVGVAGGGLLLNEARRVSEGAGGGRWGVAI